MLLYKEALCSAPSNRLCISYHPASRGASRDWLRPQRKSEQLSIPDQAEREKIRTRFSSGRLRVINSSAVMKTLFDVAGVLQYVKM